MSERTEEIKALLVEWDAVVQYGTNEPPRGFVKLVRYLANEIIEQDLRILALESAFKLLNREVERLGSPQRDLIGPGPTSYVEPNPSYLDDLFGPKIGPIDPRKP